MKKPLNFKMFYKNNAKLMSTNYPFLSRSQINARLRTQWKKINEESKRKSPKIVEQGRHGSSKTHILDSSAKALSKNNEVDHLSFWKTDKVNQTFAGGVFRLDRPIPEVQFNEKMSKTSRPIPILKKNSSPAQKFKAGQVSFSSDVKKNSYDLSDDQEDENIYVERNNTRDSTIVNKEFPNKQGIRSQIDSYEELNHLFPKTSNVQVGKEKLEPFNLEILNKTSNNLDHLDVPLSDKDEERSSEDENFYNYDEDDNDAVLLIHRDNCYSPGSKKDFDTSEFKMETTNSSEGKTNMTLSYIDESKMNVSHDNKCKGSLELTMSNDTKDLYQTPKDHLMTLRRDSQKLEKNNKGLENKLKNSETKLAKMTKQKVITSLLEEDIDSKMERFFRGSLYASQVESQTESKVQNASNRKFYCRYSLQNSSNFSVVADSRTNNKESTDIDNTSSDSSEPREENSESFFYSQHDAEESEALEEKRTIINQMFEDPETRTCNSVCTAAKRLLTSNPFQTSSNFSNLLFEDDDIFLP